MHIKCRPCSIIRAPDGIGGELFLQRHPIPLSGLIVVHLGLEAGFIAVSMIGMIAFGIVWVFMPETKIADGRT
jgi:DNA primase